MAGLPIQPSPAARLWWLASPHDVPPCPPSRIAEGSDDDFEAPAAPRGSAPPSGTQGTASQAAEPEKKGPNKFLKALDRKVQEQVYLYMKSRLQASAGCSEPGIWQVWISLPVGAARTQQHAHRERHSGWPRAWRAAPAWSLGNPPLDCRGKRCRARRANCCRARSTTGFRETPLVRQAARPFSVQLSAAGW